VSGESGGKSDVQEDSGGGAWVRQCRSVRGTTGASGHDGE
jgi:hypothetical protein